jgi:osmotically-inducible protein OsmY
MTTIIPINADASPPEIRAQAERRLRESPYYFLKGVTCRLDRGLLTLEGQVPYRQLKSIAEAIVLRVGGVRMVDNRIEVLDPSLAPWLAPAARTAG